MKHLSIFACLRLLLLLVFLAAIAPHGFSAQAEAPAPKPNQQADLDYGADEANEKFAMQNEKDPLAGRAHFNYLALRDHVGPSGVPLGGIGVGCIDLAPDGHFTRIGLSNIHKPAQDGNVGQGCFFALWENSASTQTARRLVRDPEVRLGLPGFKHSTYTGLFPTAKLTLDNGKQPAEKENVKATVYAWSGLVPQNVKDSSLPVIWFDVTLEAKAAAEVSVALSWEDLMGCGLKDARAGDVAKMDGQVMAEGRGKLLNGEAWEKMPKVPTKVAAHMTNGWQGVLQRAVEPWKPNKITYQNYVNQVAVLANPGKDEEVSILHAYPVDGDGRELAPYRQQGSLEPVIIRSATVEKDLTAPDGQPKASVVVIKTKLAAGEKKTLRFAVAWWMPEIHIDKATAQPGSYWDGADYNRYFHNYFKNLDELFAYASANRDRIYAETIAWHQPILDSTLPDWLKFKIITSAYTMYTNLILTKGGEMTVLEGAMGGLAGTMDQRISAHPFYQKFFTQLDRSEMQIFANNQETPEKIRTPGVPESDFSTQGFITHFIGHYYHGLATQKGQSPTMHGTMLDNTGGWVIQLAKDYYQTGDMDYLKLNAGHVRKALNYLKAQIPPGRQIPIGHTTYDDYSHPPIYSYTAGMYLATLNAGVAIGKALGDEALVKECQEQFKLTQADALQTLWNGRFFAYGTEIDGSGKLDNIVFSGQLGGQFMSRYCGWGDVYPLDIIRASLVAQFKTSVAHSPDYYQAKVWDLAQMKSIDKPGSQCWPFYLESYTAMSGIMAGYLDDGLDIMKNIQLVHMRKGFTWCQNLWNPGPVTYMTMPVTWFITDVLAGSNLDVPNQTLSLAPVMNNGQDKVIYPIFFPTVWATVTADPATKTVTFKVLKTFGDKTITVSKLISEPIGQPSSARKVTEIKPFEMKAGAELDLSAQWDQLTAAKILKPVLPNADKAEFLTVNVQ